MIRVLSLTVDVNENKRVGVIHILRWIVNGSGSSKNIVNKEYIESRGKLDFSTKVVHRHLLEGGVGAYREIAKNLEIQKKNSNGGIENYILRKALSNFKD
jgi:hypothetical protein